MSHVQRSAAPDRELVPRRHDRPPPRRRWLAWARPACGAAIVGLLLGQLGPDPFLAALDAVTGWALLLAMLVTLLSTVCSAWRWSVVAQGLGVEIRLPAAVAMYYRSQFLNSTLPGGVLGDVHRAVRHGRDVGAVGRGARSVVWERALGQVVQVALTVLLLLVLPSPLRPGPGAVAIGLGVLLVAGAGAVAVQRVAPEQQRGPRSRAARAVVDDLRRALRADHAAARIVLASGLAVLGHVTVFLIAMRAAGVEAGGDRQVALALIVLLAAAVPANLAGWGPREGAAAWAFAAAGVGAAAGVTVAVLYGVLALVATLPGALVLVLDRPRPGSSEPAGEPGSPVEVAP